MAKIVIIGGHGKIALLAEPMLAAAGHEVTAVIRNPRHAPDVEQAGARPKVADVEKLDVLELRDLIEGHDVVVWSAGAGGGDPQRTHAVDEAAAGRVLTAAEQTGARFVMVSYFGARPDHGIDPSNGFYAYAEAKARVDAQIRESAASWVILAPSTLTLDPEGGIEIDDSLTAATPGALRSGSIPRATVARLIAEVVDRPQLTGVTIRCNAGGTPVAEALERIAT
ncbi:NAD(P)-binding oxidoreductase [Cumulibacter manganitolerans]|uniref:NAD(P)-binding oxidoreductase n=1 Tax=Cumulibacter manganitolerans TaxID=1884992 RepID=UPI0012974F35|nr:NAD(P)-binding oxidoreductase [Cumulibacter manganitolerans]